MPILELDKMRIQTKWQELKSKAKKGATNVANWAKNNPELVGVALTAGTAVVGGAVKVCKGLVRTHNLHREQYNKERYIYDRSLGMYLHTKRPLRTQDFATINARRAKGERLSDILVSMRILD